ncbi:hypothetical protein FRC06_005958, partial [Ceratobasidium sp. 370]
MDQRALPPLSLTRSRDSARSNGPATPRSSHIAILPESPISPRSSSPSSRPGPLAVPSRPPSQLRPRDSRPPYLPFRRISLPSVQDRKRDSVASVLSADSVQEREEQDEGPQGLVSTSLPTESSMPHIDIDTNAPLVPPPPLPISGSSSGSSPSRRVVILPASSQPATPTRLRPKLTSTHHSAKTAGQPGPRSGLGGGKYSRRAGSKTQVVERNKEREEKRIKVLQELLDTEQTYVDGLDMVYNHFLAPLIESLASPHPLLTPADLSVVFPGFIDILSFNRSFLSDLHAVLAPEVATSALPIPGANPSSSSLAGQSFPNEAAGILLRLPAELSTSASSSLPPYLASNSHASIYSQGYLPSNPDLSSSAIHEDEEPEVAPPLVPNIAPLLAQHVPYLKLYKPFVTAFPASMERLAKLSANESFQAWLKQKERAPECGMLGLRSWLLTVVQRCPRYLMLVGDIVKYTGEEEEGYSQLVEVLALLSKITGSLNTSLADHTAVLALLDLQRNTNSLPAGFSFVAPGRQLIRRGRLRMSGQEVIREDVLRRGIGQKVIRKVGIGGWDEGLDGDREVLLFSDCVVWLEREREWGLGSGVGAIGAPIGAGMRHSAVGLGRPSEPLRRPTIGRTRSKSDAQLPTLKSQGSGLGSSPETQRSVSGSSSAFVKSSSGRVVGEEPRRPIGESKVLTPIGESPRPAPRRPVMLEHTPSAEDRWRFRGIAGLVDVDVVISPRHPVQIDFLSPAGSFALYAGEFIPLFVTFYGDTYKYLATHDEREEWINAIRSTKATLLATINVMHPDSTLTSSSSTTHLRRVLQALPYPPGEATIRGARARSTGRKGILRKGRTAGRQVTVAEESEDADTEPGASSSAGETKRSERRGRVENFVPAIWVPDKESANFFVMDPANADAPKSHKPERACSLCYEAVFPVIRSSNESLHSGPDRGGTIMPLRNSPARPRLMQHLMSTSPVTTPAVERGRSGGVMPSPSSPTMLTPSSAGPMGTSPSGNTILSSESSRSGARVPPSRSKGAELVTSTTARTITSLDSQRTVQPRVSSELSSGASDSQPSPRPQSLLVGRLTTASAFVHTAGVTARTKVTGRGK